MKCGHRLLLTHSGWLAKISIIHFCSLIADIYFLDFNLSYLYLYPLNSFFRILKFLLLMFTTVTFQLSKFITTNVSKN